MGLFGKSAPVDPKEKVTEWCRKLRRESTALDRQVNNIRREEEKIKRSLKDAAKKGDKDICRIYAKELIRSKKAVSKLYTSKAHINSIQMHMKEQLAILRTAGALQRSTQVMQAVQALIRVPEVSAIMREFSKEMMKVGILEEMMEDTFSGLEDEEEMEEAVDEEIDNTPAPVSLKPFPKMLKEMEVCKSACSMDGLNLAVNLGAVLKRMRRSSSLILAININLPELKAVEQALLQVSLDCRFHIVGNGVQRMLILWEVTAGTLGKAPAAASHELKPSTAKASTAAESEEEDEEEIEKMQSRLQALRS